MFQAARIKTQAAAKASSGNIQARGSRSLSAVRSAGGGASAPDTASELRSDSVISVMAAQFSTKPGRHRVSASLDAKVGVTAPADHLGKDWRAKRPPLPKYPVERRHRAVVG